jgi:hypothetical protein
MSEFDFYLLVAASLALVVAVVVALGLFSS